MARIQNVILVLFVVVAAAACDLPPPQSGGSDSACRWEAAAVEATGAAVETISVFAPVGDETVQAIDVARESVGAGRAAVDLCRDASERPSWQRWAASALSALRSLLGIARAAGAPIPDIVTGALSVVSSALGSMASDAHGASVGAVPSIGDLEQARQQLDRSRLEAMAEVAP